MRQDKNDFSEVAEDKRNAIRDAVTMFSLARIVWMALDLLGYAKF